MNGAELVKKLRETGTGESKLAPVRAKLVEVHAAEGRILTAKEALAVLVESGAGEGTIEKAQAIVETGEWKGKEASVALPIEEQLLAVASVPETIPAVVEKPVEKPAKK